MRVTVVGTGYVGLVTGTCFADMGNDVRCHDVDHRKVAMLQRGEMPIYEPGLEELVRRNVHDRRLSFLTELRAALERAEVCFIAVGTPPDEDGSADRRHVLAAAADIARAMGGPLVVAVKSTVPVGTCDEIRTLIGETLAQRGVSWAFDVVSNPEFLKEGKAVEDFMRPDRIVVGYQNELGLATMRSLNSSFIRNGHAFVTMSIRSAEMTKYASNVILATRISLMNELAHICERLGADIMDVRRGVGSDRRIGLAFLYPGIGYGGSCLPKDVAALSRMAVESDCPGDILDAVSKVNRHQRILLANRAIAYFAGDVRGKRFALWGLSFKPKTDDVREAPALTIIKRLTSAGASVCAYDPEATETARAALAGNDRVFFATSPYDALRDADGLILATEWSMFRKPDFERVKALLKRPLILDGRNQYEPAEMKALGFEYLCIGRPQS